MMERLTQWNEQGDYAYVVNCFDNGGCKDMDTSKCDMCEHSLAIFNKLCSYEDSGLTPEEVSEVAHKGLTAALDKLAEYESTGLQPEECRELADAKADGRLMVLPCKQYDNLYWIGIYRGKERVVTYRVDDITVYKNGWLVSCGKTLQFFKNDMGKTWFLTREEAEAALVNRRI